MAEQSRKFYYGANHIAAVDAIIEATKEPLKEEKCYDKIESAELTFRDFCKLYSFIAINKKKSRKEYIKKKKR